MTMRKMKWITHHDSIPRCWWCGDDPLYMRYHDQEWGVPSRDDRYLFEKICLEGFQAGLAWITVLRKRENFRTAFRNFETDRVARMTKRDVERLLSNEGIIRHRGKIESAINNAKRALEIREEFGSLSEYVWRFVPESGVLRRKRRRRGSDIPAATDESKALSKELRGRGFSFVGPTTMYAFMQSVGMVNDHLEGCHCYARIEKRKGSRS